MSQNGLKIRMPAEMGNLDVDSSTHACTKIGWTSEHIPKMLIPHEFKPFRFESILDFVETITETGKDILHVATCFHGNNPSMIFLINPNQKVLIGVVPDPTCIRPITGHAS